MTDWFSSNWRWLFPSILVTGSIILLFSYTRHIQKERRNNGYEIAVENQSPKTRNRAVEPPEAHPKQPLPTPPRKTSSDLQATASTTHHPPVKQSNKKPAPEKRRPDPQTATRPKPLAAEGMVSPHVVSLTKKFLSPEQIIQNLNGLSRKEQKKEKQKLLGLHVDWVTYLFTARKKGQDRFVVTFDSSADGFGVVVVADIDVLEYINIFAAKQGDRIRISGTIAAIDTNGTGRVTLNAASMHLAD